MILFFVQLFGCGWGPWRIYGVESPRLALAIRSHRFVSENQRLPIEWRCRRFDLFQAAGCSCRRTGSRGGWSD